MKRNWLSFVSGLVALGLLVAGMPAQAGMIGTPQLAATQVQLDHRATVEAFLARSDVKQQLVQWGVQPEAAEARVASLSEPELQQLAQTVNDQLAGGGVIVIVGVVFIVLIILELVGVTDIFKQI